MESGTVIEGEAIPVSQLNLGTVFRIPAIRQVLLLVGVAAAVAAGFAIVLWSQSPGYTRLYDGLDREDVVAVADTLRAADIDFELHMDTGTVAVPESHLHDARLELASQGLPNGASVGMKSLAEQPTFGQSQFREKALYQHAVAAELATTIAHFGAVRDARVHLAMASQSAFLRDSKSASASVMLNLYRSRELEDSQIASIVHMVASSVPNLATSNVTVVDQRGRLLSSGDEQWGDALSVKQFQVAERIENDYKRNIEMLLTPLLGAGRVRAEVVADVDFTVSEEMREAFDPNGVVVSEHLSDSQRNAGNGAAGGVPGALSNQPPEAGGVATPQNADGQQDALVDSSRSSTRNFEVDRTISHTRPQAGRIRKLSVAVLVDNAKIEGGGTTGETTGEATGELTAEAIAQVTALVKEAVGFDESRGDTVAVVNAAFHDTPEPELVEEPAFWANPLFMDTIKAVLGAVIVLALAFGLVRPMLRSLLAANAAGSERVAGSNNLVPSGVVQLPAGTLAGLPTFDEKVAAAKNISGYDPAKVAQVVKQWVEVPNG